MNKKESKAIINFVLKNTTHKRVIEHFSYDKNGHTYTVEFKDYLDLHESESFIDFAVKLGLSVNQNNELLIHEERFESIKFSCVMKFYTDLNVEDLSLADIDVLLHNSEFYNFIMNNKNVDYSQVDKLFSIAAQRMDSIYHEAISLRKSTTDAFAERVIILIDKIDKLIDGAGKALNLSDIDLDTLKDFMQSVAKLKDINEADIVSEIVKEVQADRNTPDIH